MINKIFNFQFSIFNEQRGFTRTPKTWVSGFTLVEMIVAIGLFMVVATISVGSILSIFDANRRAQSLRSVVDNLNVAIEDMARTVKFGRNYHSCTSTSLNTPQNCPGGYNLLAVSFQGATIAYRLNGTTIQKSTNGGSYTRITAPEVTVTYLRFYVFGALNTDTVQPYVIAVMRGYVGNKPTSQSTFNVQTLMSQRRLDI